MDKPTVEKIDDYTVAITKPQPPIVETVSYKALLDEKGELEAKIADRRDAYDRQIAYETERIQAETLSQNKKFEEEIRDMQKRLDEINDLLPEIEATGVKVEAPVIEEPIEEIIQ